MLPTEFVSFFDHQALRYLYSQKKLNSFVINHHASIENKAADALSRCYTSLYECLSHPIPDPTRMEDPNRVRARDYILGLIDLFFLRAELVPVVI